MISPDEYVMVAVVVVVIFAFLGTIMGIARCRPDFDAFHLSRLVAVVLIVGAILLLVGMGFNQCQIAPLLGLLAVIAGHMLSMAPRGPAAEAPPSKPTSAPALPPAGHGGGAQS